MRKRYFYNIIFITILSVLVFIINKTGVTATMKGDDLYQYYPIHIHYFEKLISGGLKSYNWHNYMGSSSYADLYYFQIDIFSLMSFLLSRVMTYGASFFAVEGLKILFGVNLFYIVVKKEMGNRAGIISFYYAFLGGFVVFALFPGYSSLIFYLPLTMLIIDKILKRGVRIFEPLIMFLYIILLLQNFYNAYSISFFAVMYVLYRTENVKKTLKVSVVLAINSLVSLMIVSPVIIPGVMFILRETSRESAFSFITSVPALLSLFIKALKPFGYMELNTNLFAPGTGRYYLNHASLFIGVMPLIYLIQSYKKNDKIKKMFVLLLVAVIILPISSLISGSVQPYYRWLIFPAILFLIESQKNVSVHKKTTKTLTILFLVYNSLLLISFLLYKGDSPLLKSPETYNYWLGWILLFLLTLFSRTTKKESLEKVEIFALTLFTCLFFLFSSVGAELNEKRYMEFRESGYIFTERVNNQEFFYNISYIGHPTTYSFHSFIDNDIQNFENFIFYNSNATERARTISQKTDPYYACLAGVKQLENEDGKLIYDYNCPELIIYEEENKKENFENEIELLKGALTTYFPEGNQVQNDNSFGRLEPTETIHKSEEDGTHKIEYIFNIEEKIGFLIIRKDNPTISNLEYSVKSYKNGEYHSETGGFVEITGPGEYKIIISYGKETQDANNEKFNFFYDDGAILDQIKTYYEDNYTTELKTGSSGFNSTIDVNIENISQKDKENIVLMLPIPYSEEWNSQKYDIIKINNGFIGVKVEQLEQGEIIEINLKHSPHLLEESKIISKTTMLLLIPLFLIRIQKKRNQKRGF